MSDETANMEVEKVEKPQKPKGPSAKGNISEIGNRDIRQQHYKELKRAKKKEKKQRREDRQKLAEALGDKAPPKMVPKTIDNMREADETTVKPAAAPEEEQDEEVNWDISNDEFKDYFTKTYEPKVLITTGDNPHSVSFIQLLNYCSLKSTVWKSTVKRVTLKKFREINSLVTSL